MERIYSYSWTPWAQHDWLSVDREGAIGCFMSSCADALPVHISISWPCLYNLFESLVASRLGCRCEDVDLFGKSYSDGVKMLADLGFYVWDADWEGDKVSFRLQGKPPAPLRIQDLPGYFQQIAKHFTLLKTDFSSDSIGAPDEFSDQSDRNVPLQEYRLMRSERCVGAQNLYNLIQAGHAFKGQIKMLDRCALEDAPVEIGPTFSTWESVRPCYLKLVSRIMEMLQCESVLVCEVTGRKASLEFAQLQARCNMLPLPFHVVEFPRREGGSVRLVLRFEEIVGGPMVLPTGYYPEYDSSLHVEYWYFDVSADASPHVCRHGMIDAMLGLIPRLLRREPKFWVFEM